MLVREIHTVLKLVLKLCGKLVTQTICIVLYAILQCMKCSNSIWSVKENRV